MKNSILVIEDNQTLREGIVHVLQKMNYSVLIADSGDQGLKICLENTPDFLICDYKLPGITGIDVLTKLKEKNLQIEVLLITAFGTIELAVESIKKGAFDFLPKPFSMEELQVKVERMQQNYNQKMQVANLNEEVSYLKEQIDNQYNFGEIIGNSTIMKKIYSTIKKVAKTDTTILITGSSGTGKELIARAIHTNSSRNIKPMVKVNCGALNENLLESELFGHEKGAFTGALKQKKGRFELANKSTLFLDEIGDISLSLQLKLLRVLQEKQFERVGGEDTLEVDVRIITATNKDLFEEVKKGNFREDLYYRLNIVPIHMPSLDDRKEDIPLLVEHFLQKLGMELCKTNCKFTEEAVQIMLDYNWPGNVRELENMIERALVLSDSEIISTEMLPFVDNKKNTKDNSNNLLGAGIIPLQEAVDQVEKTLIQRALRFTHGNKAAAARMLGLKSNTFFYKLNRYNLGSDE
jgi:DNA-binding NtrC family response regulator